MKTKILLLLLGISAISSGQSVQGYYGSFLSTPVDGVSSRTYHVLTSSSPLDESASGPNTIWDYIGLADSGGISTYDNVLPTASETATYPGTSRVIVNSIDGTEAVRIYLADNSGNIFLTGVDGSGLTINYSTDTAHIGTFPLNYGYMLTDDVSGTYNYTTYSGTFTGTVTTTVDGYGTLTTDLGSYSNVVRVKTVQALSLNYSIFSDIGMATQTSYDYYSADVAPTFPVFKTNTANISVALLSIDQTTSTIEQEETILKTSSFAAGDLFSIAPNPVSDRMKIHSDHKINDIEIADITGNIIYSQSYNGSDIVTGNLSRGVYFVTVTTDAGSSTKKFIKH